MGRPEPCVLFSQTFVHPQLDEYVDEVLFAEPVVVTACEFLEQNASSTCSAVKLNGATLPPSFALEVFVQCGGETRFRRLCQPFLYSHSSSNILEVEAVVTNHLVVRGSYRSLSLVIYGNTAEDLGQFNIEVDLDSSLTNTVSSIEGKLEDLPVALRSTNLTIEESIFPLETFSPIVVAPDLHIETKQFLQLLFKILELPNLGDETDTVLSCIFSTFSIYETPNAISRKRVEIDRLINGREDHVLTEATRELLHLYKKIQHHSGHLPSESTSGSAFLESEADTASTKQLVDTLSRFFEFGSSSGNVGHPQIPQTKNVILWMSIALLLCSAKESCFHFVDGGGMEQLGYAFNVLPNSAALRLMTLGVIEQATRHSLGCEGFLGWWPREDENVPSGVSGRYNQLLKLLMQNQRHDVASLATYILHRMRVYEVASRYESAVLIVMEGLSAVGQVTSVTLDMLAGATLQLKKLLKLIDLCGPIEDPSSIASARISMVLGDAGLLSYKATNGLIGKSDCGFRNQDVDSHLLSLLKERGFLPLSAALLSSSNLRSEMGPAFDLFVGVVSHIEAIILSLLFCRSGLIFLLHDPEVSTTIICALRGIDEQKKEESPSLRYASVLISKGFFCRPQDVATIVEMHLKVINAIDRLNLSTPDTEEFLWLLWDLCRLSRSDCGRQALLALIHFPEALSVLMAALHSAKELDPVSANSGALPLNLAIFHAAAEIFEVIVTDSTASSLGSWIGHAKELHRALRSSSPGSNKKDAPARLLELIDAGVVYHRNGVLGLLRYAAVLASGGDAHMASTSILASDTVDVDNFVGDGNIIDNLLGKRITEKDFPGVILRDSSVIQLTTAFRILAFISDTPAVAAALYDEGAVMVIHAVIINCRLMLERSSNIYDYLVDEGTECNSTSELLLERNREQSLVDLLIPSLILLINLLQKLQEAKEQHRNTKLMSALLQLHREVSPKLAACASDLTCPYPNFALGFEAVCHLIASALACWPVYGWTPGLFHYLVDSLHATSLLALGPKETCSLLCLLNDLMPDEGVWLWKHGMPILTVLRTLAVGTLLGPQKERQINWYLQSSHPDKLLSQLAPQLSNIAQIVLHCAISTLVVIQDMLRILIIRIARLNMDNASVLVQPIVFWIHERLSEPSALSDVDTYKIYRLLDFLALLLEHPQAKALLLNKSGIQMFSEVLERCVDAANSARKHFSENNDEARYGVSLLSCSIPILKSISLISDGRTSAKHPGKHDRHSRENLTAEECFFFLSQILQLCKVLPVGKELLACLSAFKELGSSNEGQSALLSIPSRIQFSSLKTLESGRLGEGSHNVAAFEWKEHPPLRDCWTNLISSITFKDASPAYVVEAIGMLSAGALRFCVEGESLNLERVVVIKYLFGLMNDVSTADKFFEESMKSIHELTDSSVSKSYDDAYLADFTLSQTKESANSLLDLLQKPTGEVKVNDVMTRILPVASPAPASSKIHIITDRSIERIEDSDLGAFGDKFLWECPENLRDRLPMKRKMSSLEGPNRRARGDNASAETIAQSVFSRGSVPPATPSGPTRRDNFRQRKPNTSRPPSMHVDDYVARERNADGTNNPNVIAVPRLGSSGRPPSIHVDEFMARQRERQNPVGVVVTDSASQLKTAPPETKTDTEKPNKSRQLKPDLDDDLQGIDIVFDAEESEPDDKLPFPQPDDNLAQPASVVVEQNSPRSIVEETESDANENSQFSRLGTPSASNMDENTPSEFSSRMSASRPEMQLSREPSISSAKKFPELSEDSKSFAIKASNGVDSAAVGSNTGFSATNYDKASGSPVPQPNFYQKTNLQQSGPPPSAIGSHGSYDLKYLSNQPPLPPMPPPSTVLPALSQMDPSLRQASAFVNSMADVQPSMPPGFHVQSEYLSSMMNSSTSLLTSSAQPDSKYARSSLPSPGGSTRPPPPLPPTPPPYSANLPFSSLKYSTSQSPVYGQSAGTTELQQTSMIPSGDARLGNLSASSTTITSYPPPPLMPPLLFSRPGSGPVSLYASSSSPHSGENMPSISQNLPVNLPSMHSIQSLAQLQPLQPPQLPRPPPQHLRPLVPASLQPEQGMSLFQSPLHVQMQPLQILQQPQVSPAHMYYQMQQQDNISHSSQQQQVEHSQQQVPTQPRDGSSEQQDSGMSLHEYFRSPEAIQSLLSDRDKLCELLEQHPKLMQMLQERLRQL